MAGVTITVLDVNEFAPELVIPPETIVCENAKVGQVSDCVCVCVCVGMCLCACRCICLTECVHICMCVSPSYSPSLCFTVYDKTETHNIYRPTILVRISVLH